MTRQPPANPRLHSVNKTKKPRALRATARPDAAIAGAAAAGAARGNARSAAARPSITPPIIIQLDPATPVGEVNGRFDMLLRGQIVASEMIEEAALHHAGRVVATLRFVPADHASETMGNGLRVLRQCFQFNLALTPEQAAGRCEFDVSARCAGIVRHEAFEVEIGAGRVTPLAGGFHRGIDTAGAASPAILFIETASVDRRGALRLEGWAVSRSPLVAIHAFAGDARIGTARLGGIREDVVNAYPGYPNARTSGFVFRSPPGAAVGPGDVVRLQASCLHGASKDVLVVLADGGGVDDATGDAVCRHTPDGVTPEGAALDGVTPEGAASDGVTPDGAALPGQPAARRGVTASGEDRVRMSSRGTVRMYCERASVYEDGRVLAVGWAVCPDGMARIDIHLDGQPIGRAEMGIERLDVGEEYAGIEMARLSGFCFDTLTGAPIGGRHEIRVTAHGINGDHATTSVHAITQPALIAVQQQAVPGSDTPEFRFELDSPALVDGIVADPVTGRLTVAGWVLAHSGVAGIGIILDGRPLGEARYGLVRRDVGSAFPEWDGASRSGFAFHCPPRSLKDGEHQIRIVFRANNGVELIHGFRFDVRRSGILDEAVAVRRRVSRSESAAYQGIIAELGHRPVFHFLVHRVGVDDRDGVVATLKSLQDQCLGEWTAALLVPDAEAAAIVRRALPGLPLDEAAIWRVTVLSPDREGWDKPVAAQGDGNDRWFGILSAGDELGSDALAEFSVAAGLSPRSAIIYADEARENPVSMDWEPFFKPDFSPDLLLSTNYIGRPWIARPAIMAGAGLTPRALTDNGDYDLILRCTERTAAIHHVPKLLCQRGRDPADSAGTERRALADAAARRGIDASVMASSVAGTWRLKRAVTATGKVSIIIPTSGARGLVETCLRTLREKTDYRNYEIICVDNIPVEDAQEDNAQEDNAQEDNAQGDNAQGDNAQGDNAQGDNAQGDNAQGDNARRKAWLAAHADRIVALPEAFNWSRFNNKAAEVAGGEFLLFLNDDVEITQSGWLDALLEHAQRPDVGVVGPQLLYPDGSVQHAGMFLAESGVARHAFRFAPADDPGYFGLALTQRNVVAVTGACMLVRADVFRRLGGFDEAHPIVNNDLDFCLRAHQAGLLTVFTPYASLIHHELASREGLTDHFDSGRFNARWKTLFAAGDPYHSPRLMRRSDDFRPDEEPLQAVHAGYPLYDPAHIRRILVVKLDHIGDFISALRPIRRLKQLFPHASISVLAAPASRSIARMEPAIGEFIGFDFFHPRSELGEREVTRDELAALGQELMAHRFDLAVDLRKHLTTRSVLRSTGARYLAGFDHMGQFPFLDIAVEWSGDRALHPKRAHVADDLLLLIEAIGAAGRDDAAIAAPLSEPAATAELPDAVRPLFARPVVAIHPGAGNPTRQWPLAHFSDLIDLLTERQDVNVIIIGGPDERELAETLHRSLLRPDRVVPIAGQTGMADLPALLAACALFIGNNSGPKHIAAACGVPTIGIHSGVVDAAEWGPAGRRAVALRRDMTCSPCYVSNLEDCPRNLACLHLLEPSLVYRTAVAMLGRHAIGGQCGHDAGIGQAYNMAPAMRAGSAIPTEPAGNVVSAEPAERRVPPGMPRAAPPPGTADPAGNATKPRRRRTKQAAE